MEDQIPGGEYLELSQRVESSALASVDFARPELSPEDMHKMTESDAKKLVETAAQLAQQRVVLDPRLTNKLVDAPHLVPPREAPEEEYPSEGPGLLRSFLQSIKEFFAKFTKFFGSGEKLPEPV